jgi:thioredoxin 1
MVKDINDQEFEQEVLSSDKPVIVDFWAEWCGPCRTLGPVIQEVSSEKENVKIVKINIDNNPETPQKYGVRGIPTLIMFKEGKVADTKVGALPKSALIEWIDNQNK